MTDQLKTLINTAWDQRETLLENENLDLITEAVKEVLAQLDAGIVRIAEKTDHGWIVNDWLKKAVLLSFKLYPMRVMSGGPDAYQWYDKMPLKFSNWTAEDFKDKTIRAVPNAMVRFGAYIAPDVVLMPSYVNLGAYIDSGTMIDTWATVGSCAQIGKNVHISGGVGIGGVLEPLQANPVIIEDNAFIGARSEVAEGVIIETGAVISMGVFLTASTKVIDRNSGEIFVGRVPAYSVVVPGTLPGKPLPNGDPGPNLACAVIIKQVDAKTRAKTSINDLLRAA